MLSGICSQKKGGFYSATDADSLSSHSKRGFTLGWKNIQRSFAEWKKEEGFYFTWTLEEIDKVLDKNQVELIKHHYGVTSHGNFEGKNIFYVSKTLPETARELNKDLSQVKELLVSARETLYRTRQCRPLPLRDEKILSGWNGLMISAFVYGYFVLDEKKYLFQAEKSADFVLK